jgi:hypothetical protein
MAPIRNQPSRVPVKRWTTSELAHLVIPLDPEKREEFINRYHEATGYDYTEQMLLNHALQLITGSARPALAWKRAKQYLVYGIPTFPQRNREVMRKTILDEGMPLITRHLTDKEADKFLNQYQAGLSSWQFLHLAGLLARAKESMRAAASKRNLGKTPAQRKKEQAEKHP